MLERLGRRILAVFLGVSAESSKYLTIRRSFLRFETRVGRTRPINSRNSHPIIRYGLSIYHTSDQAHRLLAHWLLICNLMVDMKTL
jgi:hypothetical protein